MYVHTIYLIDLCPPVPGPVIDLTVFVTFTTIELSWSPPAVPNGIITSYDVMFRENNDTNFSNDSITATFGRHSFSISDLTAQTTISDITVSARTRIGPGPSTYFSNIIIKFGVPRECIYILLIYLHHVTVYVIIKHSITI